MMLRESQSPQREIEFPVHSPVNIKTLGKQNLRLFEYLLTGKHINIYSRAKQELGIGYLNSRISNIREAGYSVSRELITVKDHNGNDVRIMDYWFSPEEISRINETKKQFWK